MANIIDALIVTLNLDPRQFETGGKKARDELKKTREEATRDSKEIELRGKQAAEFFTGLRREVTALFAAFVGGVGLTKFITGTAGVNASLGYMADNMKMSRQELFAWQEMVKQVGGTAEDAQSSFKNLANMQATMRLYPAQFAAQYAGLFNAAGLSSNDLFGNKTDFILKAVRNLQKKFPHDQLTQQNYASQLGISESMFNAAIQPNARGRINQLEGMAPSDDQIKKAQSFTKAMGLLGSTLTEIRNEVASFLFPSIEKVMGAFTEFAQKHIPLFAGALASLTVGIAVLTSSLWLPLVPILAIGLALSALIDDFITFKTSGKSAFDWGEIVKTVNGYIARTIALINELLTKIWPAVSAFGDFGKAILQTVVTAFPDFFDALKNLAGALGKLSLLVLDIVAVFVKAFGPAAVQLLRSGIKLLTDGINIIADILNVVVGILTGNWKLAWHGAEKFAVDAIKGIADALEGLLKLGYKVGQAINPLVNHQLGDGAAPQMGGFGFSIPSRGKGGSGRYANPSALRAAGAGVEGFFKANGFRPEAARGIAAGIFAESGFNPEAFNGAGGGQGAYGIGQWRGERLAKLHEMFGPHPNMDQQLQYLLWEMRNGSDRQTRNAGQALQYNTDTRGAAEVYIRQVMRPGDQGTSGDLARASQYLAAANSNVPTGAGTQVAQGNTAGTDHSVHSETHIGQVNVHTQATDANGIARDIGPAIQKRNYVQPANVGLY